MIPWLVCDVHVVVATFEKFERNFVGMHLLLKHTYSVRTHPLDVRRTIHIYIYQRNSAIELTSVGLAHARPNYAAIYTCVLEAIIATEEKGLACETKPTVCKHKQKPMQRSSNKHELMVQRSLRN